MERSTAATELWPDEEREAFFDRLDQIAAANARHNAGLTDEEVLDIIEQARSEVAGF